MTAQERMDCFWSTGILPGTIFDDLDQAAQKSSWPFRRRVKRLRQDSSNASAEASKPSRARFELKLRS